MEFTWPDLECGEEAGADAVLLAGLGKLSDEPAEWGGTFTASTLGSSERKLSSTGATPADGATPGEVATPVGPDDGRALHFNALTESQDDLLADMLRCLGGRGEPDPSADCAIPPLLDASGRPMADAPPPPGRPAPLSHAALNGAAPYGSTAGSTTHADSASRGMFSPATATPLSMVGVDRMDGGGGFRKPTPSPIIAPPGPAPAATIVPPRRCSADAAAGGPMTEAALLHGMLRGLQCSLQEENDALAAAYMREVGVGRGWTKLAQLKGEQRQLAAENAQLRTQASRLAQQQPQQRGWAASPPHGGRGVRTPGRQGDMPQLQALSPHTRAGRDEMALTPPNVPAVMPEKVESQIDKVKVKTKLCKYYMLTGSEDNCPFFGRHGWCAFAHGEKELMSTCRQAALPRHAPDMRDRVGSPHAPLDMRHPSSPFL
eukprot:TRINITY_DN2642_c2_g1_i1.p2 TRINITY_DN2642_c2_g1~~TRINITY_DN2642_c2_g1_i1.p2  ORF type:complete len:432 (+),score=109.50 TRINITY_DN2642_c2_g1_i1:128-1423(+)